jgi:hypothetical protein
MLNNPNSYMHYWFQMATAFTPLSFTAFLADVQRITTFVGAKHVLNLRLKACSTSGTLEFNAGEVCGEKFKLSATPRLREWARTGEVTFCQTNSKPYDQFVVAVLICAWHHATKDKLMLHSSGSTTTWTKGVALFEQCFPEVTAHRQLRVNKNQEGLEFNPSLKPEQYQQQQMLEHNYSICETFRCRFVQKDWDVDSCGRAGGINECPVYIGTHVNRDRLAINPLLYPAPQVDYQCAAQLDVYKLITRSIQQWQATELERPSTPDVKLQLELNDSDQVEQQVLKIMLEPNQAWFYYKLIKELTISKTEYHLMSDNEHRLTSIFLKLPKAIAGKFAENLAKNFERKELKAVRLTFNSTDSAYTLVDSFTDNAKIEQPLEID